MAAGAVASMMGERIDLPLAEQIATAVATRSKGKPAGFVSIDQVYSIVQSMAWEDVMRLAMGEKPEGWPERRVTAQFVRAASDLVSGKWVNEWNARVDGKVPDRIADAEGGKIVINVTGLD